MIYKNYNLKTVKIKDLELKLFDRINSNTLEMLEYDFNNGDYDFIFSDKVKFNKGDVVIDIGGNVGLVSIYLAKKYPFLKIYAYEPVFENWKNFKRNLEINNIDPSIVKLYNLGVSGFGQFLKITLDTKNTGASSMLMRGVNGYKNRVRSVTLNQVFSDNKINHCKILKIDCEGAEFEIFYNAKCLDKISHICGETHSFDSCVNNRKNLLSYLEKYIPKENMQFSGY